MSHGYGACHKLRKREESTDTLLRDRFLVKSVAKFCKSLKDFGERSMPLFKDQVRYEMKQFVAAAFVSNEEIKNEDIGIIQEADRRLTNALATKNVSDIYDNYSLSFNRLVVLMNTSEPKRHGEARLLDPSGVIRHTILTPPFNSSCIDEEDMNFLQILTEHFVRKFEHDRFIVCMFSHFIPCTESKHQCARLVDEFAKLNNEVIISSENVYYETDHETAWKVMKSNDRIYCLPPKELCSNSNQSTPLYDVDEPLSPRMLRRENRARVQSNPYQRPEKKKKKGFSRQKSYDLRT